MEDIHTHSNQKPLPDWITPITNQPSFTNTLTTWHSHLSSHINSQGQVPPNVLQEVFQEMVQVLSVNYEPRLQTFLLQRASNVLLALSQGQYKFKSPCKALVEGFFGEELVHRILTTELGELDFDYGTIPRITILYREPLAKHSVTYFHTGGNFVFSVEFATDFEEVSELLFEPSDYWVHQRIVIPESPIEMSIDGLSSLIDNNNTSSLGHIPSLSCIPVANEFLVPAENNTLVEEVIYTLMHQASAQVDDTLALLVSVGQVLRSFVQYQVLVGEPVAFFYTRQGIKWGKQHYLVFPADIAHQKIQPGRSVDIHLWVTNGFTIAIYNHPQRNIRVTASELSCGLVFECIPMAQVTDTGSKKFNTLLRAYNFTTHQQSIPRAININL